MLADEKEIDLSEADETIVKAISGMNAGGNDMDRFLAGLSKEQTEKIVQDAEALRALYAVVQHTQSLPERIYGAKRNDGTLVGYVTVKGYGQSESELQLEVLRDHQRQGYGTAILRSIVRQIFQDTGTETVLYRIRPDNVGSIRLVEACGGILREPSSEAERVLLKTYTLRRDALM